MVGTVKVRGQGDRSGTGNLASVRAEHYTTVRVRRQSQRGMSLLSGALQSGREQQRQDHHGQEGHVHHEHLGGSTF